MVLRGLDGPSCCRAIPTALVRMLRVEANYIAGSGRRSLHDLVLGICETLGRMDDQSRDVAHSLTSTTPREDRSSARNRFGRWEVQMLTIRRQHH